MPVQFVCPQCQKLLSVGSRKVGCQVACPKCASHVTVPPAEEAAAAVATAKAVRERLSVLEVPVTDLLTATPPTAHVEQVSLVAAKAVNGSVPSAVATVSVPVAVTVEPARPGPRAAEALPDFEIPVSIAVEPPELPALAFPQLPPPPIVAAPRAELPPLRSPARRDTVMVSRNAIYAVAVALCAAAAAAFALGYAAGRGSSASGAPAVDKAALPVVLDGKLTITSEMGDRKGDEGAVVIALPAEKQAGDKIPVSGLRPGDSSELAGSAALSAIEAAGGAYGRADDRGVFSLTVPHAGQYHVLLISRGAKRPAGTAPSRADLTDLSAFFDKPADLIGQSKYRWSLQPCEKGISSVSYHFGADGR